MSPENFTYWLQGFVELTDGVPTPEQWDSIKDHLKLVFNKVTPELTISKDNSEVAKSVMSDPILTNFLNYTNISTNIISKTAPRAPYNGPQIIC